MKMGKIQTKNKQNHKSDQVSLKTHIFSSEENTLQVEGQIQI